MPPGPLHYQLLLGREIFVTEQIDMHLVWTIGRIFLKPIPRFLLEPRLWIEYLTCISDCSCSEDADSRGVRECARQRLWKSALGLLFSYAALISHESNFYIAKEKHLLPGGDEITWQKWRTLVEQLDTEHISNKINERFLYGELRLSRLNKIFFLSQHPFLRGYMPKWREYGISVQENWAWLASATVYIVIVLTAMQVGLATNTLVDSDAFQSASHLFTLFSILGPLVAAGVLTLAFCYRFVNNWVNMVAYKRRRFHAIQARSEGS